METRRASRFVGLPVRRFIFRAFLACWIVLKKGVILRRLYRCDRLSTDCSPPPVLEPMNSEVFYWDQYPDRLFGSCFYLAFQLHCFASLPLPRP